MKARNAFRGEEAPCTSPQILLCQIPLIAEFDLKQSISLKPEFDRKQVGKDKEPCDVTNTVDTSRGQPDSPLAYSSHLFTSQLPINNPSTGENRAEEGWECSRCVCISSHAYAAA